MPDRDGALAEFLTRYDMWNPEHEARKWEAFSYARRECAIPRTEAEGGFWILTRYEVVRRVLEDPETFSSKNVTPRGSPVPLNPLDADPSFQQELRKLLNPLFSRNYLMRYEPQMRAHAAELIDSWAGRNEVELVTEFATPFVSTGLARLIFDETDEAKMLDASEKVIATAVDGSPEAFHGLATLATDYLAARGADDSVGGEVLGAVVNGTLADGQPLTEHQQLGVLIVLFIGGLDTTRGAIASIAHRLAQQPELEDRIRDPRWVRMDLDEFVRAASPVGCLARDAAAEVELNGVHIKAGDRLLVRFDSANYDEEKFEHPHELVFDPPRRGHVGFGLGIHRCLGMHLARIQIAVAFEELLARVTNLRLRDPESITWAPGIANGPQRLDLTFDRIRTEAAR